MTADAPAWGEVKSRLADVLARPQAEREALLRTYAPALREAVRSLLGAHDTVGGFLDDAPLSSGDAIRSIAESLRDDPLVGEHVGPWRVCARLGQGGMGTVYRAERADGLFERTVALKVVRARFASGPAAEELQRRFDAERRLLAGLDHPGIARLFDGGALEDGRPWLAMEIVEGEPLTDWAERHGLDASERLALFLDTLDALAHAHRHLVVHCDLKPSHITVETDGDGHPRVCVLDFGIAAALGSGPRPAPGATPEADLHTTAYAAPEQLAGGPLTTSADVFALGVVLFELLAGRRPEREASGAVTERLSDVAPHDRQRRLRGDLDAVVERALATDPDDRYPSAEAFASDLRRHLRHLPVEARPQTAGYRAGRFLRRHRITVAASGAVLAAVLAFGAYHTAAITAERNAARREAAKASATASFLTDVFRTYNPDAEIGDRVSARALLDARVARLRATPDDPATPALLDAAARAYAGLALYDEATPLAEQALALRRADPDASADEVFLSLLTLADLRLWTERYASADSLTREALGIARRQRQPTPRASALRMRARYVALTEGHARADSLLSAALALQRQHLDDDHPDLAATLHDYGAALVYSSQDAEAVAPLREALRIRRARLGPSHPDLAETLTLLGVAVLHGEKDQEAASRLLTEADRIFDEALDRAHPEAATTLMNLGHLARDARRWDEADAYYRRGLALRRALLGPDHHSIAASLNNMAYARALSGDADGAYGLYDEARRVLDNSFPDGHIRTTYQMVQMGKIRRQQGRYAESAALLRDALQMRQRVASHRPKLVARARLHLAATLVMLARHADAERLLDLAAPHITSPEDMDWTVLHRTLAQLYAETDRPRLASRHEALRRP